MFTLHGLEPGAVSPSRGLLLQHARPEHRPHLAAALSDTRSTECEYTLVSGRGREHDVVLVADQAQNGIVSGHLIDITTRSSAQRSRAVIEQAKGMMMLAHGVESDRAFELLAWCSQQHNVKLSALADRLVSQVRCGGVAGPELRLHLDDLLLDCSRSSPPLTVEGGRPRREALHVVDQNGVSAIRLEGQIDLVSANELSSLCGTLLASARPADVLTVDLRAASNVGAAGVSVLHALYRKCLAAGVALAILVDRQQPAAVARLQGLPLQPGDEGTSDQCAVTGS
ncbi:hypothetical protein ASE38_01645 [Cellulomonas sp. Root930]|nr:hypothetical protein ASE38_01645 [Cellulomonas sp. Root930]